MFPFAQQKYLSPDVNTVFALPPTMVVDDDLFSPILDMVPPNRGSTSNSATEPATNTVTELVAVPEPVSDTVTDTVVVSTTDTAPTPIVEPSDSALGNEPLE